MRNSLCVPVFAWKLGLINSTIQVPIWVSHVKMCHGRNLKKISQLTADSVFRYFKYLSPIKLIDKYCISVFCIKFSDAIEIVSPKI